MKAKSRVMKEFEGGKGKIEGGEGEIEGGEGIRGWWTRMYGSW